MSYTPAASSSSFITNRPTSTRTKRRLSNATPAAALDHSDHEDEEDYSKQPRSKRNRAVRATSEGDEDGESAAGDSISQSGSRGGSGGTTTKALSEKEKDARRQARMIRNRNAAQASRDRKKEHTLYLERRVAELEARLNGTGPHPLSISTTSPFTASSSSNSASSPSKQLARSQRSNSITSSTSSSEATRLQDLEEENEILRTQLHLEQTESARLRARLDTLLEHSSSGTTTPFPHYEPTFAFNTADLKPLPQPEELAFVEERERQKPAQLSLSSSSSSSSSNDSTASAPFTRSPSLSASISSTPSTIASLDLASTPPSTESYLEDLDNLAPPPMWNEWVKSDPDSKEEESAITSGLAFVDFDFLHDAPVVASC